MHWISLLCIVQAPRKRGSLDASQCHFVWSLPLPLRICLTRYWLMALRIRFARFNECGMIANVRAVFYCPYYTFKVARRWKLPPTFAVSTLAPSIWSTPLCCLSYTPPPAVLMGSMCQNSQRCMCGAVGLDLWILRCVRLQGSVRWGCRCPSLEVWGLLLCVIDVSEC